MLNSFQHPSSLRKPPRMGKNGPWKRSWPKVKQVQGDDLVIVGACFWIAASLRSSE